MVKKILVAVVCVLLAVVLCASGYIFFMLSRISRAPVDFDKEEVVSIRAEEPNATPAPTPEALEDSELDLSNEMEQTELTVEEQAALAEAEKKSKVTNVLLLGVDRRGSSGTSRSDTTMIATLDGINKRLKLSSLMRDMYLPIPGYGENRFNSACVKGGPDLVMQTINENFSMDLEKYVLVDFRSFEKIVDRLGGVTIELSSGEVSEANDCIAGLNKQRGAELRSGFITKRSGMINLTGKQALGYARIRHFGNGDYARTSRQYKVLQAVMDKFKGLDLIEQQKVMYDLLPLVETNLTNTEILGLMVQALAIGNTDILHFRIPADGTYKAKTVRGMSVLLPDIPANAKALHEFIYEATEQPEIENSDTMKGTYHPKAAPTATPEIVLDEFGNPVMPADDSEVPDESGAVHDADIPDENTSDESESTEDSSPTNDLTYIPEETNDEGEVILLW